jgi:hypothetical protein
MYEARAKEKAANVREGCGDLSALGVKTWLVGRLPVTQGQALNDNAINISFRISAVVPNPLYLWITQSRHRVDRVIRASNIDDHSASPLATQLSLSGGRPAETDK